MSEDEAKRSMGRRRLLAAGMGIGAAGLAGSALTAHGAEPSPAGAARTGAKGSTCVLNSSVTEGPYYLDGALFRKDITEGKEGVPLRLRLTVQDQSDECRPVEGAAVEIWHCDAWGYYSGFTTKSPGGTVPGEDEDGSDANDDTYLRGFQLTDAEGIAEITTIVPGWYMPRTCHIHVKVHTGGAQEDGTYEGGKVNWTGQLYFDDAVAEQVFASAPYERHEGTWTRLADDSIYDGNGAAGGLLTLTENKKGSLAEGWTGTLTVGIDPEQENDGGGGPGGGAGK